MPPREALSIQIATSALKEFGDRPTFQLNFRNVNHAKEVSRSFNRLGCQVRISQDGQTLTVAPPSPVVKERFAGRG